MPKSSNNASTTAASKKTVSNPKVPNKNCRNIFAQQIKQLAKNQKQII
jgi:hypothetical protein